MPEKDAVLEVLCAQKNNRRRSNYEPPYGNFVAAC